jgi:hypothetical protein
MENHMPRTLNLVTPVTMYAVDVAMKRIPASKILAAQQAAVRAETDPASLSRSKSAVPPR